MNNLKKRIKFWSERNVDGTEGSTIPYPFKSYIHIFDEKDILEIGPGYGRQFKEISLVASTYCIADICQKVLDRRIYQDIDKFLITSYKQNLNKKFDIITFWYVMHHLLLTELDDFFLFLNRHLSPEGYLFFNSTSDRSKAQIDSPEDPHGDGIMTTSHNMEILFKVFSKNNFKVLYQEDMEDNCCVFLVQKLGDSI